MCNNEGPPPRGADKTSMPTTVVNFGGNVRFAPQRRIAPRDEEHLLQILAALRGRPVRVAGSLHSWSPLVETPDVLLDLRHFNDVDLWQDAHGDWWAEAGGGCQIKHLLAELNRHSLTTPSVGLITEQTIAGAISTGTHGSGRHSLSHYMEQVRLASYDQQGRPRLLTIDGGELLRAARCSLGCLGVITKVRFRCVPQYLVLEQAVWCDDVQQVLGAEEQWPLQQFFLIPHGWRYIAQQRRVAEPPEKRSYLAPLYRAYWLLAIDVGLHVALKLLVSALRTRRGVRWFYRQALPWLTIRHWQVRDRSDRMLVMEHELFRHLETEVFVTRSRVEEAAGFVRQALSVFDGADDSVDESTAAALRDLGLLDRLHQLRGSYTHHYPICFRRVLPDDTLISMASGDEAWYAISFITYREPREPFCALAEFLAESMSQLFGARLHWGKHFPLSAAQVERQYPHLPRFREIRQRLDPTKAFVNDFVRRTGLS